MFQTLADLLKRDKDMPERAHTLAVYEEFQSGEIYDRLSYEFHQESEENGRDYIPMAERRPSIRYGLPEIIVNDSTGLLFGDGHFPAIDTGDKAAKPEAANDTGKKKSKRGKAKTKPSNDNLAKIIKDSNLQAVMLEAAVKGAVGSSAVLMRVLKNRIFFDALSTKYLTPKFKADAPDTLEMVREKYKVTGTDLKAQGYDIRDKDLSRDFWFQRDFTETEETWYLPWPVRTTKSDGQTIGTHEGYKPETRDPKRSVPHNLGFCPMEWFKNLPGGKGVDGRPTCGKKALGNAVEIDYLLSQGGRGLKYTCDPTLLIKEPGFADFGKSMLGIAGQPGSAAPQGGNVKGAANAIKLDTEGDAKMLEITGAGFAAVLAQVDRLREMTLEHCGGSRVSPDKIAAAQSGKAMELMNAPLISLASKLRSSYGETGLVSIVYKIAAVSKKFALKLKDGEEIAIGGIKTGIVSLKWPPFYPPTATDHQALATAIKTYRDAGVMSRPTGIQKIAHDFDVEDVEEEQAEIEAEEKAAADAAAALKAPSNAAEPTDVRAAA